jgi:hypothetical protein
MNSQEAVQRRMAEPQFSLVGKIEEITFGGGGDFNDGFLRWFE